MGRNISSSLVYGFKLEIGYEKQDEKFHEKFLQEYCWEESVASFIFEKQGKKVVTEEEESQLLENLNIEFKYYGYTDCDREWILAVRNTEITSYDAEPKKITLGHLKIDPKWEEQLKTFCDLVGLKFREPNWLLTGSYE